jgi:hypothetical protein
MLCIVADATLNGYPIGSELKLKPGQERRFQIRIQGTAPIAAVQIIHCGYVLADLPVEVDQSDFFGEWADERPGRPLEDAYYYVRDATGRSDGGTILFTTGVDNIISVEHKPAPPDESSRRLNVTGEMVDFGAIRTNGAFRLLKDKHLIIPLPGSRAFDVTIDLVTLGTPGTVDRVEALNEKLEKQEELAFTVDESQLSFRAEPDIFAYRIGLR